MNDREQRYIHGYSQEEQARLIEQARFMAPVVYEDVNFDPDTRLIEVGCGVGAQTEILLERFPSLRITGIDISPAQIEVAKQRLGTNPNADRVTFEAGDAKSLPYPDNSFDAAFLCFFLEHVSEPVEVLQEVHRVLRPSGKIICSEVQNATFFLHPYSPATLSYWFEFNDHQWNLGGDPFVGAKLANLLQHATFQNVTTQVKLHHYDNRMPKRRAEFLDFWVRLLHSGAPSLIDAGKVTPELVTQMTTELQACKQNPDAVFFFAWMQASAYAY